MNRVMNSTRLMILIMNNHYLTSVLRYCNSPDELEKGITATQCLENICLVDIDWIKIYSNLKEVLK